MKYSRKPSLPVRRNEISKGQQCERLTLHIDVAKRIASLSQPVIAMAKEAVNQGPSIPLYTLYMSTSADAAIAVYSGGDVPDERAELRASVISCNVWNERQQGGHGRFPAETRAEVGQCVIRTRLMLDLLI